MPPKQGPIVNLETTAEKSLGKEINLVNKKDLNHLDLVIEAKNNRLKSEFFYIYDYDKFNDCSLLKLNFDILAANAVNHTSARYVVHYLTKELKSRLKEIDRKTSTKHELSVFYDIFKPSLGQFDEDDISDANDFIRRMFPYEGCSYTGEKLEKIITKANWITIVLSLRIIWSLLPDAIVPWESYKKFKEYEESTNFTHIQSFYQRMPIFLPSHNHCCVLFEFLEIFIAIFEEDYLLDLKSALDLVFTAGQICFSRNEFTETNENSDDDLHELQKFYYKRGYSFHQIFVSYLRSLSKEPAFEHQSILDTFKINEYPPKPYQPVVQKALTLTVPADADLKTTNYFKLISMAANATSRIYSSNHTFTKFENKFLDKFEINPHKIIEHFFSKSSKNYLLKFDKSLDFDNFKVNDEISELRKNLKEGTIFENKEFVSTFISEFSRYGFESQRENGNNPTTFLADTINFNFNSKQQNVDNLPVRVSKLEISEWFINAWKYETFLGYLQNTVVLKLTKTIGDCDWLIVTSHEKVSATNRYLTPPSSAQDSIDAGKERELGSLKDDDESPASSDKRKSLLPAFQSKGDSVKSKKKDSTNPHGHPHASPLAVKRSPKPDLKRISFPSAPRDIAVFENEVHNNMNPQLEEKKQKKTTPTKSKREHKKKLTTAESNKPLPPPMMPNQRITTPTQQVTETMPTPPPMVQDSHNIDSMVSHQSNFLAAAGLEIATPIKAREQKDSPNLMRPLFGGVTASTSPLVKHTENPVTPRVQQETPAPQFDRKLMPLNDAPSSQAAPEKKVPGSTKDTSPASEVLLVEKDVVAPLAAEKKTVVAAPVEEHAVADPVTEKQMSPQQKKQSSPSLVLHASPKKFNTSPAVRPASRFSNVPDTPTSPAAQLSRAPSPPPSKAKHPYQMLKASPPRERPVDSSSQPKMNPPQMAPPSQKDQLMTPPMSSTEMFQTSPISPPGKTNPLSKLIVNTNNNVKSKISPPGGSSPMSQVLPKFFTKKSSQDFSKMTASESSNSLAHINDGSGSASHKQSLLVNNPELKVSVESIPEIPYTPRALRESRVPSISESQSTSSNHESELSRVISDNRESFVGNLSTTTGDSKNCFDSESDCTQETTKTTIHGNGKASDGLDGLLDEIKESMDNDKFFSVDDLVKEKEDLENATIAAN